MNDKRGITLIELLIAATVMVVIVGAGFYLLQSGSKAAGKGGSYLASSIAAANLARILEIDIQAADKLEIVSQGRQGEINLSFSRPAAGGRLERIDVTYIWPAQNRKGVTRSVAGAESRTYCSDRYIDVLELSKHEFGGADTKHGYQINLSVAGKDDESGESDSQRELVNIKRFTYAHNASLNSMRPIFNAWNFGSP